MKHKIWQRIFALLSIVVLVFNSVGPLFATAYANELDATPTPEVSQDVTPTPDNPTPTVDQTQPTDTVTPTPTTDQTAPTSSLEAMNNMAATASAPFESPMTLAAPKEIRNKRPLRNPAKLAQDLLKKMGK